MRPSDPHQHNDDYYLEPVSSLMARAILEFFSERKPGSTFKAGELYRHVSAEAGGTAPASADCIVRAMRQKKGLNYTCISRRYSLYQVEQGRRTAPCGMY
jgi:hypothetical protein